MAVQTQPLLVTVHALVLLLRRGPEHLLDPLDPHTIGSVELGAVLVPELSRQVPMFPTGHTRFSDRQLTVLRDNLCQALLPQRRNGFASIIGTRYRQVGPDDDLGKGKIQLTLQLTPVHNHGNMLELWFVPL